MSSEQQQDDSIRQLCEQIAQLRSSIEEQTTQQLKMMQRLCDLVETTTQVNAKLPPFASPVPEQTSSVSPGHVQTLEQIAERLTRMETVLLNSRNIRGGHGYVDVVVVADDASTESVKLDERAQKMFRFITIASEAQTGPLFNTHYSELVAFVELLNDTGCLQIMESISTHLALQTSSPNDDFQTEEHVVPILARAIACVQHSHLKKQAIGDISHVIKFFKNLPDQLQLTARQDHLLAIALHLMGSITEPEESMRFFEEAIRVVPYFGYAFYSRGLLRFTSFSEVDAAMNDYNTSLEFAPMNSSAQLNRALIFANIFSDYKNALETYDKLLKIDPKHSMAYNNRGMLYEMQFGDLNVALENYNKAIECDPSNVHAFINRGHFYVNHFKDFARAIDNYNTVLQIEPQHAKALFYRATVHHKHLNDGNRALQDYIKSLQCDSSLVEAYIGRGQLYAEHFNDTQKALGDYNRALQLEPKNSLARVKRAMLYHSGLGDSKLALEEYSNTIDMDPSTSSAYYNRAILYEQLNEMENAEKDYMKALQLDPTNEDAENALKRVQLLLGKPATGAVAPRNTKKKIRPRRNKQQAPHPPVENETEISLDDLPSPFSEATSPFAQSSKNPFK